MTTRKTKVQLGRERRAKAAADKALREAAAAAEGEDYRAAKRIIRRAQKGLKSYGMKEIPPELIPVAALSAEIDAIARAPKDKKRPAFASFDKKMDAIGKKVRSFFDNVPAQKTPVSKEQKKSTVQSAGQGPKQAVQSAKDKAERTARRSRLLDTKRQSVDDEVGRTGVGRPTRKMAGERGVSFPALTKPTTTRTPTKPVATKTPTKTETPKTPAKPKPRPERPKTVDTRPKPKSEKRKPDRRSMPAEDTTPRRPRRTSVEPVSNQEFGLDTLADRNKMKRFMKERFNITVTYDDDERQAREDRGEGSDDGGRAKGGLFTRRGGMYKKPARKK